MVGHLDWHVVVLSALKKNGQIVKYDVIQKWPLQQHGAEYTLRVPGCAGRAG